MAEQRMIAIRIDEEHEAAIKEIRRQLQARNPGMRHISISDAVRYALVNSASSVPVGTAEAIVAPRRRD
jgi:hypothetical protein